MKIRFLPEAEEEVFEAQRYYRYQSPNLGTRFARTVQDALRHIRRAPTGSSFLFRPYRKRRLKRFKYGLIYEVFEQEVVVYAFAHHARQYGYWLKRVRRDE